MEGRESIDDVTNFIFYMNRFFHCVVSILSSIFVLLLCKIILGRWGALFVSSQMKNNVFILYSKISKYLMLIK